IGTVWLADRCIEKTQIVVDLGHRTDCRARVLRGRPLLDRNRGREALDRIDVGLLHLLQKLTRVGRERLDVSSLAFREDRVESERGLARARDARDDDEAVAWNVARDVLQVVLPRAADTDRVHGGWHSKRLERKSIPEMKWKGLRRHLLTGD